MFKKHYLDVEFEDEVLQQKDGKKTEIVIRNYAKKDLTGIKYSLCDVSNLSAGIITQMTDGTEENLILPDNVKGSVFFDEQHQCKYLGY